MTRLYAVKSCPTATKPAMNLRKIAYTKGFGLPASFEGTTHRYDGDSLAAT